MRVNITTAAKLTGRSEKTLRTWLAEEPTPLSVELGPWRGGRRMPGKKQGEQGRLIKGRTRLLDMQELRELHVERGGTEWYTQYEPVPDASELARRLEAVEQQLAALRDRAPWLFAEGPAVDAPAMPAALARAGKNRQSRAASQR